MLKAGLKPGETGRHRRRPSFYARTRPCASRIWSAVMKVFRRRIAGLARPARRLLEERRGKSRAAAPGHDPRGRADARARNRLFGHRPAADPERAELSGCPAASSPVPSRPATASRRGRWSRRSIPLLTRPPPAPLPPPSPAPAPSSRTPSSTEGRQSALLAKKTASQAAFDSRRAGPRLHPGRHGAGGRPSWRRRRSNCPMPS